MRESVGRYHRPGLHQERAQYLSILLQSSDAGAPCYITDADFTDGARITRKLIQRLAQLHTTGTEGPDAWKLVGEGQAENFLIKGGNLTDDGMAGAWVGGLRATLFQDVDYKCERLGAFSSVLADQIHHRYSVIEPGVLTDDHAKWTPHVFQGLGLKVQVGGLGEFTITDNTKTTLILGDGFPGAGAAHAFYYFTLAAVAEAVDQTVWLDVHIEDWGMLEDPRLNHNPGGTAVECARRERLIKRVWVQQVHPVAEQPTVDYTDLRGARHYVLKLGTLPRVANQPAINPGEPVNDRNENAPSGDVLEAARLFRQVCVEDVNQPEDLARRLERETSFITVGPNSDHPGMFTGPQGLLDALACNAAGPRTVFLRNGTYALSGLGSILVREGWSIIGESDQTIIYVDENLVAANGPCVRLHRNARLENLTLIRDGSGVGDADMVLLAARESSLHRVRIADEIVPGSAVRVGLPDFESPRAGGVQIRACLVHKYGGRALVVERPAVVEFAATSVVGALPVSDADPFSVRDADYGILIDTCLLRTSDATSNAAAQAAVYLGSADDVRMTNVVVQTDGGRALHVEAKCTLKDAPAIQTGRGGVELDGVTLLYTPDEVYANLRSSVASFVSGNVVLQNLRVEALSAPGSHPSYAVDLATSAGAGEMLRIRADKISVRSAAQTAIHVAGDHALELDGTDFTVFPVGPATGPATGVSLYNSTSGKVSLRGARVLCASNTTTGINCIGDLLLQDSIVDGAAVELTPISEGEPPLAVVAAFRLTPGVEGTVPRLHDARAMRHGGVGFYATAVDGAAKELVLDSCHVVSEGRTAFGFLVKGPSPVVLRGCSATRTRAANVYAQSAANRTQVMGGAYANAGLAWYAAGFPVEGADFHRRWAACIRGARKVIGVNIGAQALGNVEPDEGYALVGISSPGQLDIESCLIDGARTGVLAETGADMRIHGGQFLGCVYPVEAISASALHMHSVGIRGTEGKAITAIGVPNLRLVALEIDGAGKARPLVHLIDCGEELRGAAIDGGSFRAPDNHEAPTVLVDGCNWARLRGLRVAAFRGVGVRVSGGVDVQVEACDLRAGASGIYSLEMIDTTLPRLRGLQLEYGARLSRSGGSAIDDVTCANQGLVLLESDGAVCRLRQVRVLAVPNSDDSTSASGIYVGGSGGGTINGRVVLDDCEVLDWRNVGLDLTSNAAGGRSAGIRLAVAGANSEVTLRRCRVQNNTNAETRGLGVLIGNLNYIADTVEASGGGSPGNHCYGVQHMHIEGCEFKRYTMLGATSSPFLVAVLRRDAHVLHNNIFDVDSGSVARLYREQEDADELYARVDFKGNSSLRRALSAPAVVPYVEQAAYIVMDGGITDAEWLDYRHDDEVSRDPIEAAARRTNSINAYTDDTIKPNGDLPVAP